MSKRKLGFLAVCAAIIGLTVLAKSQMNGRTDRITRENISRVQVGMTEAEVEDIFAVPSGNYHADEQPKLDDHDPRKLWYGGDGLGVVLRFGADGKVSEVRHFAGLKEMNLRRRVVGSARNWMNELFDMLAE